MSNYNLDLNLFKVGFWMTILFGIAQLAGWVDVSIWVIFLPLMIAIGWYFIVIFLIGLITLYFVDKELNKREEDSEKEEIDE